MEGQRSQSVCCPSTERRVQTRVCQQTQTLDHSIAEPQCKRGTSRQGNPRSNTQRGHRGGEKPSHSRILFSNLPGPKENRRDETSDRFVQLEQTHCVPTFQDGKWQINQEKSPTRDVGLQCRSEGRVFPYPNTPFLQEVPQDWIPRQSLPVQSVAFWPVICPLHLHQDIHSVDHHCQETGLPSPHLPGRLAGEGDGLPKVSKRQGQGFETIPGDGMSHKLGQVRVGSDTKLCVCGHSLRPQELQSEALKRQDGQDRRTIQTLSLASRSTGPSLAKAVGPVEHTGVVGPLGKDSSEEPTVVPPVKLVSTQTTPISSGDSVEGSLVGHTVVVKHPQCLQRDPSSEDTSSIAHEHRCLRRRMGSTLRRVQSEGILDRTRELPVTYQCTGDEGSKKSSTGVADTATYLYIGQDRQYDSGIISQQTRGDEILGSHERDLQSVQNPRKKRLASENPVLPRGKERDRGQLEQTVESDPFRVVTAPPGGTSSVQSLGDTSHRPVRDEGEHKTPSLRIPSEGSPGIRRRLPRHELEEPVGVRLSSRFHHVSDSGEDPGNGLSHNTDSTSLARPGLVQYPTGPLSRGSDKATSVPKTPKTNRKKHVSHKSRSSEASCLERSKHKLRKKGFREDIHDRILVPQRDSTRVQYKSKWRIFLSWCDREQKDIFKTTIADIADFLFILFSEQKLRAATIEGYKSAIANEMRFISNLNVRGDEHLKRLIQSFHRDEPKYKNPYPKWNLALVLNRLIKPPFEPIEKIDLKWLTWKTAFLMLLATGGRTSEIHALDYETLKFHEDFRFLTVELLPEFKAKNQASGAQDQRFSYQIPALKPTLDRDLPDTKLCPIRAMNAYRAKTHKTRKESNLRRVFVSYMKGKEGKSQRTPSPPG